MKDFAAIDFETANGRRTSVCSVGVVVVRGGEVVDTLYSLIRPRPNFYSRFTTAIHGLSYEDTAQAPDFADVWKQIAPRIEGLPLVAHNSPFDEGACAPCSSCTGCLIPATGSIVRAVPRAGRSAAACPTTSSIPCRRRAVSTLPTTTMPWPMPRRARGSR